MSATVAGEKTRWAVAAGAAAAILGVVLVLFRGPEPITALPVRPAAAPTPKTKPVVQLASPATGDSVLAEELVLRDMRPLFLPTEGLNVALPERRREPGKTFLDNETLKLSFGEADLSIGDELPPVATINGKAAHAAKSLDVLAGEAVAPALQGFGRSAARIEQMEARGGFVEIVAIATGHRVWAEALPVEVRPPGNQAWQPAEFVASVNPAGLTAPLVVTTSSQVEDVDAHFRNFLTRRYRIGDRLPPGFYRITVGP
jgi:hypothetical protein